MKIRHHADSAHGLEPGMIGDTECKDCISEEEAGKEPLITDGAQVPKNKAWFCIWRRDDGLVSASAGDEIPETAPDRFEILLTTNDWEAARMAIRAWRTAAVMNQDVWPIEKSAESNLLGVLI